MHFRKRALALGLGSIASSLCFASATHHKILLPAGTAPPPGYTLLADYIHRALYRGEEHAAAIKAGQALMDADMLLFDRQMFNTQTDTLRPPPGFARNVPEGAALHIVQFVGPILSEWLDELRAAGAEPVHYVANYGYLVWADGAARERLDAMAQARQLLQFSEPMPSFLKLDPSLSRAFADRTPRETRFEIIVQRYAAPGDGRARIDALGLKATTDWQPVMVFENAQFTATLDEIRALVEMPDVNWVEHVLPRHKYDEVQAQIIRGHFNVDQSGPAGPGYREWLLGLGFPTTQASYPIIDITDDGIGNRTVNSGDPTLHEFGNTANPTRLAYNQRCTAADGTVDGHGHINANIAGGYDVRTNAQAPGAQFPGIYQRGLGMNPWTRIGGTRIFAPGFNQSNCGGSDAGVILAVQQGGAAISGNSWGCSSCAGSYNTSSQAYDAGTRDANPGVAGNQEIIFIFAAGNSGPGAATVGTPGNGKNMITVGASENQRPVDENGNWTDGCGIGPTGADNAMDIIGFSSRGPSPGGRVKPEVIAPGTHITGTQPSPTTGSGTCDATRPVGNATYNASSGTSHSTPAVAGVASLVYHWIESDRGTLSFENGTAAAPSPALMKAWLMAHPTYLTGVSGNGNLPTNAQGYGMPNLELMFTETPKYLVDQSVLFTDSGQQWTWDGVVADPSEPLRIALAYTDQPGATGTSPQVNNLDLVVIADGDTYLGNRFSGQWSVTGGSADAANNYEAVFLPAGSASSLEIRVLATNIAGDGVPGNGDPTDQDFALVCSNCVQEPTFTLQVANPQATVCTINTSSVDFDVTVASLLGFTDPVTLAAAGAPAGATTSFTVNPVVPPGVSSFGIGSLGVVAAGDYEVTVSGTSDSIVRERNIALRIDTAAPDNPGLVAPANGVINQPLRPTFEWAAVAQASSYELEVSDSSGFGTIIYSAVVSGTSHVPGNDLPSNSELFWRVRAANSCDSGLSAVRSFFTEALPGDCPIGTQANTVFFADFDGDNSAWTLGSGSSGASNWAVSTARSHSAPNAFLAQDIASVSDQRLDSPAIALPSGELPLNLIFWNDQVMERRTGGCFDGGMLEISTDGGASFVEVGNAQMLTRAYDGPISTSHSNPAGDRNAWCGDPRAWERMVVNLAPWQGQTVRLRFRVATDSSVGRTPHGWYIDDVRVQSCRVDNPDLVFADGFEN